MHEPRSFPSTVRKIALCAPHVTALAGAILLAGCQSSVGPLSVPGFGKSSEEIKIERQAKQDPFPSPSDVGLQ